MREIVKVLTRSLARRDTIPLDRAPLRPPPVIARPHIPTAPTSSPTMNTTVAGTIKVVLSILSVVILALGVDTTPEPGQPVIDATTSWLAGAAYLAKLVLSWVQAKLSADSIAPKPEA